MMFLRKYLGNSLYLIQLFDYNCPTCVSGVTEVFTDDIDEFTDKYLNLEKDVERKDRFLRSKAGEIVIDYYSDDPDLNIVKEVAITNLGSLTTSRRNQVVRVKNGCGWYADYRFGLLEFEIRWVMYNNKIYKLVKPKGRDCCRKSSFSIKPWTRMFVYGNPFWIYQENKGTPDDTDDYNEYNGNQLLSYVWQIADTFDNKDDMKLDMERGWLSEKQISRALADLPGDVG